MSIKIVCPDANGCDVMTVHGVKVFNSDGTEIENVIRIQMDMSAGDILTATLTIAVSEFVGFDCIRPHLSAETQEQLAKLGYRKVEE